MKNIVILLIMLILSSQNNHKSPFDNMTSAEMIQFLTTEGQSLLSKLQHYGNFTHSKKLEKYNTCLAAFGTTIDQLAKKFKELDEEKDTIISNYKKQNPSEQDLKNHLMILMSWYHTDRYIINYCVEKNR